MVRQIESHRPKFATFLGVPFALVIVQLKHNFVDLGVLCIQSRKKHVIIKI